MEETKGVHFITLFIYWPLKWTVIHTSHAILYPNCCTETLKKVVLGCVICVGFHATKENTFRAPLYRDSICISQIRSSGWVGWFMVD